jgi:outer membrane immunogenic protein
MIKFLLGAIGILALGESAANAADLATTPYPPMLAPASVWTGCYVGVEGGGTSGPARTVSNGLINGAPAPHPAGTLINQTNVNGGLAGGTIGCNYQINSWVVGIEGDGSWSGRSGSTHLLPPLNQAWVEDIRGSWLATIRGREGFVVGGNVLLYGTAGAAFADLKIHEFNPIAPATTPFLIGDTQTRTLAGWTVGAGAEWRFAPNLSAKVEYLYLDFGHPNYFQTSVSGVPSQSIRVTDHLARAGINYLFDWAGPVSARY